MAENVPCTIRVFNQTGAHTHYPTNIRLLTPPFRRKTRFPRVSGPQAPLGALSRTAQSSRRDKMASPGPKSLT